MLKIQRRSFNNETRSSRGINLSISLFFLIKFNFLFLKKEKSLEMERDQVKKLDYLNSELAKKLDEEKRSKSELLNLKKDYNETLTNLERQVGFHKILSKKATTNSIDY